MGIHDRDYYRSESRGMLRVGAHSIVTLIIIVNVAVWLLQLIFSPSGAVTSFLACRPDAIFSGIPELWRLVTANFAHSSDPWHIFMNMLFLFFFGRELEQMYGTRDFLTLYLGGGILGVLAESASLQAASANDPRLAGVQIIGASAAVAAVLVVFTLYYPKRTILFFFFIPAPVWLLCVLFLAGDILGVTGNVHDGVAHFAHLAGAGFGFLFKYFDLRWFNVRRWLGMEGQRSRGRAASRRGVEEQRPRVRQREKAPARLVKPRPDSVSQRIDQLLAKIHEKGMGSLTEEEREFLHENSKRYRGS